MLHQLSKFPWFNRHRDRALVNDAALMEILLPTPHADFPASEHCSYVVEPALASCVAALADSIDQDASRSDLKAWREQTPQDVAVCMFSGRSGLLARSTGATIVRAVVRAVAPCRVGRFR